MHILMCVMSLFFISNIFEDTFKDKNVLLNLIIFYDSLLKRMILLN